MFYVYIIRSVQYPGEIYTGFTENLKQRIEDHNYGRSSHTSKFLPWELIYYGAFLEKQLALDFESYLKSSSGIAFRNKRLLQIIDKKK